MAEKLKQEYNLVVLKVEVQVATSAVRFTLQAKIEGQLTAVGEWASTLSELGANGDPARAGEGRLSASMVEEIRRWMLDNIHDGQPLWVHLVKPYGALRFLPWERAFGSSFGFAILMLPDFLFPPPRESSETLDVALCASAPLNAEESWVREALQAALGGILKAAVRKTEVHLFTDLNLYQEMRAIFGLVRDSDVTVTIYDPLEAAGYASADLSSRLLDSTGQLRSPWLLWMRHALVNRSVDVVHVIGHGYLSRDRGALLLAQSPLDRTDDFRAGPVGAIELGTFMTQVGAWGTVLTGVIDNHSPLGLRALADEIGQSRPGPVLMHTLERDPHQDLLAPAYRLLFDTKPSGMPVSDALYVYCQPYRVGTTTSDPFEVGTQGNTRRDMTLESPVSRNISQTEFAHEATMAGSALDKVFKRRGPMKPWIAATERVAEQVQLRLQKHIRDIESDDPSQDARTNASISMLDSLRESVASFAEEDAQAVRRALKSPAQGAPAPDVEGGAA